MIRSVQEKKTIKTEHYLVTAPIKEKKKVQAVNGGLKQSCVQPPSAGEFPPFPLSYASLYSILLEAGSVSQLLRGLTVQINTASADHTSLIITEAAPNWEIDLLVFV